MLRQRETLTTLVVQVAFLCAVAAAIDNASMTPTPTTLPADFRGRVAFACHGGSSAAEARPAMVWSPEGRWRQEPDEMRCLSDFDDIRDFCRRAYPSLAIANVEPAVELQAFPNWCPLGRPTSPHRCPIINVKPYECLSGTYQSPSLLVSSGCRFMHNSSDSPGKPASCHRDDYWQGVARRSCASLGAGQQRQLSRYGLLMPCNFMPGAGYFAGVEFVCCPEVRIDAAAPDVDVPPPKKSAAAAPAVASAAAARPFSPSDLEVDNADTDDAQYQRYLDAATEAGHSEHERFGDAKRGLQHHQARREGAMVAELREAEARIAALSPRDPESAKRLLDEVDKQFRRSFLSVQREEAAERDQLDEVHQQRVNLLFVRKLTRVKQLLAHAVAGNDARAAGRYFARLTGLVAREVVRVANRAGRLSGHLSADHLATLRRHSEQLLADLKDVGAEAGLRRVAGIAGVAGTVSRHAAVLQKARRQLADAAAAAPTAEAAAYPPKLAERFDNLLRLYHEQSVKLFKHLPLHQLPPIEPHHQQHQHHHQRQQHHQRQHPYGNDMVSDAKDRRRGHEDHHLEGPAVSAAVHSPVYIGLICGFAILLILASVFIAVRICRAVVCRGGACGKAGGYKLSLVDDDYSSSSAGPDAAAGAAYSYPTVKPEKACLGDPHLANMQANGYENPTYKFYEEK